MSKKIKDDNCQYDCGKYRKPTTPLALDLRGQTVDNHNILGTFHIIGKAHAFRAKELQYETSTSKVKVKI